MTPRCAAGAWWPTTQATKVADALPLDPRSLRSALGRFATGVTIVTCLDKFGERAGLTANSFSALSLEPPLVMWSLRLSSPSLPAFVAARTYAINVLGEAQVDLSRRFASATPDKFSEGPWTQGDHGAPVLSACAAVFECAAVSNQGAGDHMLFIGRVVGMSEAPVPPLIFQAGHYRLLGEVL